jgi:hypothetical protein
MFTGLLLDAEVEETDSNEKTNTSWEANEMNTLPIALSLLSFSLSH